MSQSENEPAYKLCIEDLTRFESRNDGWYYTFAGSEATKIGKFQIQGTICKVAGFNNEILIISDETGKAKATRGPRVPGDFSWVQPGAYCSVVGCLADTGKLPHINIIKLAKVNNDLLREMWPMEVAELKQFLTNRIAPKIPWKELPLRNATKSHIGAERAKMNSHHGIVMNGAAAKTLIDYNEGIIPA